ncbi:MAG: DUF2378 family protein [Myxococcota bacterium]
MPTERLIFPTLIEGYMKGLGPRFDEALKKKLKARGLDVTRLPPAIPADEMTGHMRVIAAHAWPDEPEAEQLRMLGLSAIRGWSTGAIGSAASALIRLIGPKRALARLDRAFSTSNNFNRSQTELIGDDEALVTINDVQGMPSYWLGILEAAIEIVGRTGTVIVERQNPPEATFRLKWK